MVLGSVLMANFFLPGLSYFSSLVCPVTSSALLANGSATMQISIKIYFFSSKYWSLFCCFVISKYCSCFRCYDLISCNIHLSVLCPWFFFVTQQSPSPSGRGTPEQRSFRDRQKYFEIDVKQQTPDKPKPRVSLVGEDDLKKMREEEGLFPSQ